MSEWDPDEFRSGSWQLMTKDEFIYLMNELGLHTLNDPWFFLSHERTVRRWIAGECPIPGPVAAYLRTLYRLGLGNIELRTVATKARKRIVPS